MRINFVEPSANLMNPGDQLNPTVRAEKSQTFRGFLD
jgi:hypothetical protein